MTAPTIRQIKAHIGAFVSTYTDTPILLLNSANGYKINTLPAAQVFSGRVLSQTRLDSGQALETRQYFIDVLVTEIPSASEDEVKYNAEADAEDLLNPLKSYLSQQLMEGGLIHDVGEITDIGVGNTPYRGKTYSIFRLLIPIVTVPS